jgi:hypothetical protein
MSKPSFEGLIVGAPIGFAKACTVTSSFQLNNTENFDNLVLKSLITYKEENVISNSNINDKQLQLEYEILQLLLYIVRSRAISEPTPTPQQFASILDSSTTLSRECIGAIVTGITTYESSLQKEEEDGVITEIAKLTQNTGI